MGIMILSKTPSGSIVGAAWKSPKHSWRFSSLAFYCRSKLGFSQQSMFDCLTHRIHGAAIYGNIYHQYTPVMLAYIPYMDPMGEGMKMLGSV